MTTDTRVVVLGASSGLGRTIALGLARRGARVAFLARRKERLDAAVAEAGTTAVAVTCDVTDETSCRDGIAESAAALGGIDALVYATGILTVSPIEDVHASTWARLFATNVTGAALATSAALPFLTASRGAAVYLSSVSASLTPPWPNIGAYVTSKAALDKLVEAWRAEHGHIRFTRLTVGDCAGGDGHSASEFVNDADPTLITDAVNEWLRLGYMTGNLIDPDDLVDAVDTVVRCRSAIPTLTLTPTSSPSTTQDDSKPVRISALDELVKAVQPQRGSPES
ncbi:SDR family oxidoreductase [Frankia sp. AgB1.9]|uniref:SDR family oxidoreductase n=1 Tax=unclassified Frankia TaxID=2632575 RepID=UPI00193411B1|nr:MULTISPECIES: SDR family oxidoreductase [unclassified Frankia]MBL7492327.1 SDR family oxidoreductase [Frankia sp. AgW1.1]MBL7551876.1 SDR family oxidoreductase [Frankia sp. AgB1.9]MBL7625544.1 SDR family oxidoreductase [Frankia sp. AgB1.8]